MQYIKLSKEQLYELVKKYSPYKLPDIENTEFQKAHRAWAYWLEYSSVGTDQESHHVVSYIEYFLGQATMRITCRRDHYDQVLHPALEDMEGMIFEDGRDAPWIIRYIQTDERESFRGTDTEVLKHAYEEGKRRGSEYIIT